MHMGQVASALVRQLYNLNLNIAQPSKVYNVCFVVAFRHDGQIDFHLLRKFVSYGISEPSEVGMTISDTYLDSLYFCNCQRGRGRIIRC